MSERQIIVYKREDLSNPIATVGLDVSPAILIPFYDEDSSTLFLTGKVKQSLYLLPTVDFRLSGMFTGRTNKNTINPR